jgi:hypothetical protein
VVKHLYAHLPSAGLRDCSAALAIAGCMLRSNARVLDPLPDPLVAGGHSSHIAAIHLAIKTLLKWTWCACLASLAAEHTRGALCIVVLCCTLRELTAPITGLSGLIS